MVRLLAALCLLVACPTAGAVTASFAPYDGEAFEGQTVFVEVLADGPVEGSVVIDALETDGSAYLDVSGRAVSETVVLDPSGGPTAVELELDDRTTNGDDRDVRLRMRPAPGSPVVADSLLTLRLVDDEPLAAPVIQSARLVSNGLRLSLRYQAPGTVTSVTVGGRRTRRGSDTAVERDRVSTRRTSILVRLGARDLRRLRRSKYVSVRLGFTSPLRQLETLDVFRIY